VGARGQKAISGKNLVGFEVGGVLYAIDIYKVREIVRPSVTLPLPHLPETVVGVVDHRGDVVPIIDLRTRFAVAQSGRDRDARWIIVNRADRLLGLAVDRVTEVFGTLEADARALPKVASGEGLRAIRGAYAHAGRLVFVLDVDVLTQVADRIVLPEAAELKRGVDGGS
jgi:purine-binding chemotaxis protein CheW